VTERVRALYELAVREFVFSLSESNIGFVSIYVTKYVKFGSAQFGDLCLSGISIFVGYYAAVLV
jgi:hypothetical protein